MERTLPISRRVHSELYVVASIVRLPIFLVSLLFASVLQAGAQDKQALIREALSAAPPEVAKTAIVKNWDGTVLKPGTAYMLAGDVGSSNTDPYAEAPTSNNQWVEPGPHLMVLVPNPAELDGVSTDPYGGGPFVMWKGTPYVHIMVPVGKRPEVKH